MEPSVTTDKGGHTIVKNINSLTVNNKKLKSLNVGDKVRARNPGNKNWLQKGKVIEKHSAPTSYNDNNLRRNNTYLLLTN